MDKDLMTEIKELINESLYEERVPVKFAKVHPDATIPSKLDEDAGYDCYARFDDDYIVINPHTTKQIPLGIASAVSDDWYFQIEERGSTGALGMITVGGVFDSGYRGEWMGFITNGNDIPIVIAKEGRFLGMDTDYIYYPYERAICQAVMLRVPKTNVEVIPYEELKKIPSIRGKGRVGSSGK